ncbi:MAG TPA: glycosyl transferase family 2, partial [Methylomirabilota bacterium]|nr:glycosyl transferase family 2 [Methylomirabilota bacterium]
VLGPRAVSSQRPPAPLGPTVGRVASALFAIAERHEAAWLDVRGSEPVPVFGVPPGPASGTTARAAPIDPERMLVGFRQGVRDLLPIWERILAPDDLGDMLALSEYPSSEFRMGDRLWARVVYDFLLAYRARVMYRSHITQSLAPLYLGRVASLVLETRLRPDAAVAQSMERLARVFEDEKPYLVDRWR